MPIRYTPEHEWLRIEGDLVVVGITEHASEQLGDVVFVELPEVGRKVEKGDEVSVIESVKAASDILAPLAGEIVEVNEALPDTPALVNEKPMEAWFFKMKVADLAAVEDYMSAGAYEDFIG
ncbi:glycine cleavage system protein H [Rhodobacter capsulatus R121]|jgi:glycine cleavage system H protein|uniref:Glycine cleavage system H protein n=1 Tax=Rhodobacter capsulatus (strain ATCC BAA-309 / NBRC 16581 / SB1003) TaxID=272942 RepID=D5ARN0_RHOCB|nr:glycine cleavage system H protein [Rhodobacter capsulatus SB 1003]ETD02340.1 glycine cleavage system protein H [Rhodobacter capsulatus DE442]ETD77631.1 glycine cleavage system protein H [Rhodobacter capsulatus R121]ETE54281.1 glycine cleavage system protein H [Rhodobacter capsulatus Y262]